MVKNVILFIGRCAINLLNLSVHFNMIINTSRIIIPIQLSAIFFFNRFVFFSAHSATLLNDSFVSLFFSLRIIFINILKQEAAASLVSIHVTQNATAPASYLIFHFSISLQWRLNYPYCYLALNQDNLPHHLMHQYLLQSLQSPFQ